MSIIAWIVLGLIAGFIGAVVFLVIYHGIRRTV
jgi:uncharacterized membrane protein YeaQ/YmgE (transglycosylase-associated protein family)